MTKEKEKLIEKYRKIIDDLNKNSFINLKEELLKKELNVKLEIYNLFLKKNQENNNYKENCLWLLNKLKNEVEIKSKDRFELKYDYRM